MPLEAAQLRLVLADLGMLEVLEEAQPRCCC